MLLGKSMGPASITIVRRAAVWMMTLLGTVLPAVQSCESLNDLKLPQTSIHAVEVPTGLFTLPPAGPFGLQGTRRPRCCRHFAAIDHVFSHLVAPGPRAWHCRTVCRRRCRSIWQLAEQGRQSLNRGDGAQHANQVRAKQQEIHLLSRTATALEPSQTGDREKQHTVVRSAGGGPYHSQPLLSGRLYRRDAAGALSPEE